MYVDFHPSCVARDTTSFEWVEFKGPRKSVVHLYISAGDTIESLADRAKWLLRERPYSASYIASHFKTEEEWYNSLISSCKGGCFYLKLEVFLNSPALAYFLFTYPKGGFSSWRVEYKNGTKKVYKKDSSELINRLDWKLVSKVEEESCS